MHTHAHSIESNKPKQQKKTTGELFLEMIMTNALEDHGGTVSIGGRTVTNLRFADDIDGWVGEGEELTKLVERLEKSLHGLRHSDQCREDQADDKQYQWHQHRDRSKWTEAWDSPKLQVPGLHYNWRDSKTEQTTAAVTRLKPIRNERSICLS